MNTDFIEQLRHIVGADNLLTDAAAEPYCQDWRGRYSGRALAVALPADTRQVSEVVTLCAANKIAMVPQGGNTSLCGAAVPLADDMPQLVINLSRMQRIRNVDAANYTMVAEAGCKLADLHQAAEQAGRLFPLGLTAIAPHCEIGGNLSTNAGGLGVLRYGSARDLVLGLEVVLPDGRIWEGLRSLRKDNTGYDLKHLFIGAEGTLGIITAAVVKLFPAPRETVTAWLACPTLEACLSVFGRLREASGDAVSGCELVSRTALEFVLRHLPQARDPLGTPSPWYLLVELTGSGVVGNLRQVLEQTLAQCLERGSITDAALADSLAQGADFWRLREAVAEVQRHEGASIKNDVAVPVSAVPAFVTAASAAVQAACPGLRVCAFGHIGDGNIHFNLSQPPGMPAAQFLARWEELAGIVNAQVAAYRGSVSAEHGIGLLKREALADHEPAVAIDLMRRIKAAIDPADRCNPGKVLAPD